MTRAELWAIYAEKNPQFNGEGNVTLNANGLRKLFDQTWDIATEEANRSTIDDSQGAAMFNQIFGNRRKKP